MENKMTPTETTVYTDSFDKSIYNVRWFQLPSEEELVNKSVVFRVDPSNPDKVNKEMVNKLQAAYSSTYGAGIDPEAVRDLLECLKNIVSVAVDRWRPLPANSYEKKCLNEARSAIEKATIK
jgi:hypothetical protein